MRARRKEEFEELQLIHEQKKAERRQQRKDDRLHQRKLVFIDQCRIKIEEKYREEEAAEVAVRFTFPEVIHQYRSFALMIQFMYLG